MLILITVGLQIQPSKGRLRNNRIAVITLKRAVCEYPTSVLMKSRCTISGEKNEKNESNESNEKNGKSDWSVSFVVSLRQKHSCFASDWRSSGTLNVEQSLSRICNPTAPSISICNALINNI